MLVVSWATLSKRKRDKAAVETLGEKKSRCSNYFTNMKLFLQAPVVVFSYNVVRCNFCVLVYTPHYTVSQNYRHPYR